MTSSHVELHTLRIETGPGSVYLFPLVNLLTNWAVEPQLTHNPCFQIINEEYSVFSISWSIVTRVSSISQSGEEKLIWSSGASAATPK